MSDTVFHEHEAAAAAPRAGLDRTFMWDGASRRFPPEASSVGAAREFVRERLAAHGGDVEAVVLMVSELATNAIEHGRTDFDLTLRLPRQGSGVRVEVHDSAPGYPIPQHPTIDDTRGRGLQILQGLAQSWGVDIERDRPGKTVWFCSSLPAAAAPLGGEATHEEDGTTHWPVQDVRAVLDELRDAVVATDMDGRIRYANASAEELMGWSPGTLVGRSALELVPDSMIEPFRDGFARFVADRVEQMVGHPVSATVKRADGTDVATELVVSLFDDPAEGRMVVGSFRPHDDRALARWSGLTNELLEILGDTATDDPPAERLLSTLGRQLDWDVTTLWALTGGGRLVCRHVWTRGPDVAAGFAHEKAVDPTSGSEGLPRWVIEHGEPIWIADLARDERFLTDALAGDGLRSAYAFPVRHRGSCVGVVKMLSLRQRERDAGVVELMDAVGDHLGEWLHASALAAEREQLVEELLETRRGNEFLLLATKVLSEVVGYREMVERLAQVAVPVMADLCLIDIVDEDGTLRRMAAWHADPSKRALTDELRLKYAPDPEGVHPILEVMRSGRSMWGAHMDDEFLRRTSRNERHYSLLKALGFTSYMTVPLRVADDQILGTVTLVSAGSGRRFSQKNLVLPEQLAQQVSSVVFRARAFDRERRISHELQRNLLPDAIPAVDGWDVVVRYLPAASGVEVGGDWYDVVPIDDRRVALVVGDVEGHDLGAAKFMSRLRHTLGLLVFEEGAPGQALDRLNRATMSGASTRIATAIVGVLDTVSGTISFASAGHLSPLAVGAHDAVELPVTPGPPLGVETSGYKEHEFQIEDECIVLFTDGLVERRGTHIDARLDQLQQTLRGSAHRHPEQIVDAAIDAMTSDTRSVDDIVVLAARRATRRR